jgi:hypothetical protein
MTPWKRRIRQSNDVGMNIAHAGIGDITINQSPNRHFLEEAYQAEALAVSPREVLDRDKELGELADLAASDGYIWYKGSPWAGKSALLSWFASHPPDSVRVAVFFVNSRLPGEANSDAFVRAMVRQLAGIAGISIADELSTEARRGQILHSLNRAADAVTGLGQRLVVLVDGLDEDQGHSPSIAYSMPKLLPPGVRVIVSSRPYPQLPGDLPGDHPLRSCESRIIEPSPHATRIRDDAAYEITKQMAIPETRDLLGFLVTAGGGLSARDLAELSQRQEEDLAELLSTEFGRVIDTRLRNGETVWLLAHDMLLETAKYKLAGNLSYLKRIHEWADSYGQDGWQDTTPDYLTRSYVHMLLGNGDNRRAFGLATDHQRHQLMLRRTGADALALTEIAMVQHSFLTTQEPDLLSLAILAFNRCVIGARSESIPALLPGVWAQIGDIDRAEALARSIVWPEDRALALVDVARAAAPIDPERAAVICASATAIVPNISRSGGQVGVLVQSTEVLSEIDPSRAEQFARSNADAGARTLALSLARIADRLIETDPARAIELCEQAIDIGKSVCDDYWEADGLAESVEVLADLDPERAERLARAVTIPHAKALALVKVAIAIGRKDPDRVLELCGEIRYLAESTPDGYYHQSILAQVASGIADLRPDEAEQIARSITHPRRRAEALMGVAYAAVGSRQARAEEIVQSIPIDDSRSSPIADFASAIASSDPERAERLANSIDEPTQRASILAAVASAINDKFPERAATLSRTAEQLVSSIDRPQRRASALVSVARAISDIFPDQASRLCKAAEQAARISPDFLPLSYVLAKAGAAIIELEPTRARNLCEAAERIAQTLTDGQASDFVLRETAVALAGIEPQTATQRLDRISWDFYIEVLPRVVAAVAAHDPKRAIEIWETTEQVAANDSFTGSDLAKVAVVVAGIDPDRAERIIASISHSDTSNLVTALARTAMIVGDTDASRATRLRERAEQLVPTLNDTGEKAVALAEIASAVAIVDAGHASELEDAAEGLAMSISDTRHRDRIYSHIVSAIARSNSSRADRICQSISTSDWREYALGYLSSGLALTEEVNPNLTRRVAASLLVDPELDMLGGNWTLALPLLARVDKNIVMTVVDQIWNELLKYTESATLLH